MRKIDVSILTSILLAFMVIGGGVLAFLILDWGSDDMAVVDEPLGRSFSFYSKKLLITSYPDNLQLGVPPDLCQDGKKLVTTPYTCMVENRSERTITVAIENDQIPAGYTFRAWEGCSAAGGLANECPVKIDTSNAPQQLRAVFEKGPQVIAE